MYVSTFTNIHGENCVFIQHQLQPYALFICGDDLTPDPVRLTGCPEQEAIGVAPAWIAGDGEKGIILGEEESIWLTMCWDASEYLRERFRQAQAA
jgi:hypothetical protein